MIVTAYQIKDTLDIEPLTQREAANACKGDDARVWLDLQGFDPSELEPWLDELGVAGLARQLCLEAREHAGFYPLREEIFMVIPLLIDTKGSREVDCLALLCRQNLLLTLHQRPIPEFSRTEDARSWLSGLSIAALVSAMMIELSQVCLRQAGELKNAVVALEERMETEPESIEADEILSLRSDLVVLDAVSDDQLPAMRALGMTNKPFFLSEDAQDHMNCAVVNIASTNRSMDRLREQIGNLRAGLEMKGQEKTNRRLGVLSILSAVFMPSTLLAGIWGMNFQNMPELAYANAYPIALGAMMLIGSGMYLFFRSRGWFG